MQGRAVSVFTCSPTKLVYGAFGSAAKNFSHCSALARRVKSALSSEPVETFVLDPEVTWTRIASLEPTDWTPIVTGSTMALVSMKACHCLSLSRLFWRDWTDLLIACGRLCHAWAFPLVDPILIIVLVRYKDEDAVRVDASSQSSILKSQILRDPPSRLIAYWRTLGHDAINSSSSEEPFRGSKSTTVARSRRLLARSLLIEPVMAQKPRNTKHSSRTPSQSCSG